MRMSIYTAVGLAAGLTLAACGAPHPNRVAPAPQPAPDTCAGWTDRRAALVVEEARLRNGQLGNFIIDRTLPILIVGGSIAGAASGEPLAIARGQIEAGDRACGR